MTDDNQTFASVEFDRWLMSLPTEDRLMVPPRQAFVAGFRRGGQDTANAFTNALNRLEETSKQKTRMLESALHAIERLTGIVESTAIASGRLDDLTVRDLKNINAELRKGIEE